MRKGLEALLGLGLSVIAAGGIANVARADAYSDAYNAERAKLQARQDFEKDRKAERRNHHIRSTITERYNVARNCFRDKSYACAMRAADEAVEYCEEYKGKIPSDISDIPEKAMDLAVRATIEYAKTETDWVKRIAVLQEEVKNPPTYMSNYMAYAVLAVIHPYPSFQEGYIKRAFELAKTKKQREEVILCLAQATPEYQFRVIDQFGMESHTVQRALFDEYIQEAARILKRRNSKN